MRKNVPLKQPFSWKFFDSTFTSYQNNSTESDQKAIYTNFLTNEAETVHYHEYEFFILLV